MANLDTNFLARPDFVVNTGENGQTITLRLLPRFYHTGDETQSLPLQYYQNGIAPFSIIELCSLQDLVISISALGQDTSIGLLGVSPTVIDNLFSIDVFIGDETQYNYIKGIYNFFNFVSRNPIHIKSINLRAENEQMLPQQIVVLTPNIFTGQSDRQIIDVASRKTSYQYQSGIITIDDADLIICRNSSVAFNSSFNIALDISTQDIWDVINANPIYMDITIDKYFSLEKAFYENLRLLK